MSNFICPICNAEYSQKQKICTCGFEGIEYIDYYNPLRYDEDSQNTIFKIYKFSKKVAVGEINFKPSPLSIIDTDNIFIDEILEKRGLAYVYAPDMILSEGVFYAYEGDEENLYLYEKESGEYLDKHFPAKYY